MSLFFTKISKFTNDAAGLEKCLRGIQSLVQIIAFYALAPAPWLQARKQIALGRRYFRIFKWIDAFKMSHATFMDVHGIVGVLETGKWSCLGMYFFLEMFTILDAMGVYQSPWAAYVFNEANKFWFYSICLSGILGLIQLWELGFMPVKASKEPVEKLQSKRRDKRMSIMKRLVIDACDLFIPGSSTGWIDVTSASVGMASTVSTVLASTDIWERVQNN